MGNKLLGREPDGAFLSHDAGKLTGTHVGWIRGLNLKEGAFKRMERKERKTMGRRATMARGKGGGRWKLAMLAFKKRRKRKNDPCRIKSGLQGKGSQICDVSPISDEAGHVTGFEKAPIEWSIPPGLCGAHPNLFSLAFPNLESLGASPNPKYIGRKYFLCTTACVVVCNLGSPYIEYGLLHVQTAPFT